MTKRRVAILMSAITVIVLLAFTYVYMDQHKAPTVQKPLTDLNVQTLDAFRTEFNAAKDRTRIVLLLSPT